MGIATLKIESKNSHTSCGLLLLSDIFVIMSDKNPEHYIIVKGYIHKIPINNAMSSKENLPGKKCCDCRKLLTFREFCRNNPTLPFIRARDLWEDPLITPYCPNCFFNRPEKPFNIKRREFKMILKEKPK